MPTGCSPIEMPRCRRWRIRFELLEELNHLLGDHRLNRQWIHPHQLFSQLKKVISLNRTRLALHANRRKVTGTLNHHHPT